MRIYPGQTQSIAREVVHNLLKAEAIEVVAEQRAEAEEDVESVLQQYIRTDRAINDEVREIIQQRGLGNNAFSRIKRRIAKDRDFTWGEDALDWITAQVIEMLLYSGNIEEVFVEDRVLRRHIAKTIRSNTDVESDLDREVRNKLKNLEEGSSAWDIEYERAMGHMKRKKGLV